MKLPPLLPDRAESPRSWPSRGSLLATGAGFAFVLLLSACGEEAKPPPSAAPSTWHYQLQNLELEALAKTKYDLVVIDYSKDGSAAGEFAPREIAALQASGKTVLAYFSIGEAESYRYYWQRSWRPGQPSWLLHPNPDYLDNYLVQYWHPAWQDIIYSYLDEIVAQGFDGVYLDRVDAYESHPEMRSQAALYMADLIEAIGNYVRNTLGKADSLLFIQNGEPLGRFPQVMNSISGIAREETYCSAGDQLTDAAETVQIEGWLDRFLAAGKTVLTVDYCQERSYIQRAYERARSKGYVPFFTTVELDRLVLNSGQ